MVPGEKPRHRSQVYITLHERPFNFQPDKATQFQGNEDEEDESNAQGRHL